MKINVVGTTASGKTTFGKELAETLGVAFIEMDAIFWEPNWQEPSDTVFFENLQKAIDLPSWVLDGNYTRTIPIKWKDVDTVIWLDYSFRKTIFQSVISKDSIILWCLRNYRINRKKYEAAMNNPEYSHIQFVRLRSHQEAKEYLALFEK